MVQHAMTFLDGITDQKNKLEMIDTLRTVTEGKVKHNFQKKSILFIFIF